MKIIANEFGLKILNIPKENNRPNNMLDAVEELAKTAKNVYIKDDVLVVPFKQKEIQNERD